MQDMQANMVYWQRLHALMRLLSANIGKHLGTEIVRDFCFGQL